MESDGQALLKLDALHGIHAMLNSGAHARLHRSYGNGIGPLQLRGELNTEPLLQGREHP